MVEKSLNSSVSLEQAIENAKDFLSTSIMYVAERDSEDGFFSESYSVIYNNSNNITNEHLNKSDRLLRDEEIKARLRKYLKEKSNDDGKVVLPTEEEAKAECLQDIQKTEIPLFTRMGRLWDYEDPTTFYHFYNFKVGKKIYEVGFNYVAYRKRLSDFSSTLLKNQVALSLVIIVLFPLFFRRVITNPLGKLLLGVKKVNEGDLGVKVPEEIKDEIGFISSSFNRMVDSISNAQSELKNYSENLKLMVDERTEELKNTMGELEASNTALILARDELWGEMQLAKKIQAHLVPANPALDNYEISSHMLPADDVGGDYYDVMNLEERDWIVIGDVSGHGVSAGLIMMMVQTAIQVATKNLPQITPAGLIEAVNSSITENIRRFEEDKYMTITVLASHQEGSFYFAGLHQDILIYRAETNDVETVETEGMWIGVMENIDGLVHDNRLKLQINDTMLLFTDGMIEAIDKNALSNSGKDGGLYGHAKLISLLRNYGKESTEIIKSKILESLELFEINDDVTFLLIKRNK